MKKYSAPCVYSPRCAQWFLAMAIRFTYLLQPEKTAEIQEGLDILEQWLRTSTQIKVYDLKD